MITSFFQPKSKKAPPATSAAGPDSPPEKYVNVKSDKRTNVTDESSTPSEKIPEVQELLSLLDNARESDEKIWRDVLEKCFSTPSFARLASFVSKERQSKTIYPPLEDTFSALNYTPLDNVKVVIVGQDPYHGPGQAHGLCFSVRKGIQVPPSLRNIYKELVNDAEVPNFTSMPKHGYLESWARQGVLMINTVLTVQRGVANSHKNKGWELVTDEIIRAVDRRSKENGKGLVFLLWGKPATAKATTALPLGASSRHTIICTSHPSPLGATKTKSPFMGSKCFSKANAALKKYGYDAIDWRVTDVPVSPPEKRKRDNESFESKKRTKTADKTSSALSDKNLKVQELLSLLDNAHESNEKTWRDVLEKSFATPSFSKLASFVSEERQSKTVFPPLRDTFSALNYTPLDNVKVVIVGQDPYHGPGQAHGLCFSVRKGIQVPPSLRNIYKELVNDAEVPNFTSMPKHGYLENWARQGVLMINDVLTVRQGEARSHKKKGWELVTDEIIRAVDRRSKDNGKGLVFLLWGKPATAKATTALSSGSASRHTIICTSHPSPLGATKTNSPFMGSKCFSKANAALKKYGYDEIDWRVDGDLV